MKRAFITVVLATLILCGAWGHPHVFMDTRIEAAYDAEGLSGFWITWKFDKVFTAGILMDFDSDKNEQLSASEVAVIEDRAFSNLVNYNYFVYIRSTRGQYRPASVEAFTAYMEAGRVHYRFFVPYPLPIGEAGVRVNVAVYDETFFCDIGYAETAPLLLPASDAFSGEYTIREDRGIRIDYPANDGSQGSTFPRQMVLTLRREG
jgi:ABC-type uncharacterized transport system substrate-binding protein